MLALDARLAAVAVRQHGVFTRVQARAAGFSAAQIDRRLRAAVWVRMLPRVYRHATTPVSSPVAHWAAVLWAGPDCALSHASAAAIWRIRPQPVPAPELIVPNARAPRVEGVVVRRVTRIADHDVVRVHHLPVTAPVATVIDLAGVLDDHDLEALIACAGARRLLTVRAVRRRLDEIDTAGRPGITRLRALLSAISSVPGEPSDRMAW